MCETGAPVWGADMGRHISDALTGRLIARPETEFSELLKQLRRFPINRRRTKVVEEGPLPNRAPGISLTRRRLRFAYGTGLSFWWSRIARLNASSRPLFDVSEHPRQHHSPGKLPLEIASGKRIGCSGVRLRASVQNLIFKWLISD